MTAEQLLEALRARGVTVDLEGEDLHVRGELSDQERVTLRHLKPDLVELLRARENGGDNIGADSTSRPARRSRTRSATSSRPAPPDPDRSERARHAARQMPRGPGGRFAPSSASVEAPKPEGRFPDNPREPEPATQPRRRGFFGRVMWGDVVAEDE